MGRAETEELKTIVIYSGIGLGVAAGALIFAKHLIKNAKRNAAEKSSASEGDPTTFAKQLHMAFENDNYFGWGTNMNLIMEVFNSIPSKKHYEKVQKAYHALYSKNLNAELESELTSEEYNAIIRILGGKRAA